MSIPPLLRRFAPLALGTALLGAAAAQDLTLLQFADVHEIHAIDDGANGGFPKAKTVIDSVRASSVNTPMVVISGDFLAPSLMSSFFQGSQTVAMLNHVGVNFGVLGNHEFDFGPEVLEEKLAESNTIWMLANMFNAETGQPLAGAYPALLVDWEGTAVGLIGLANDWRDITSAGDAVYVDYVEAAATLTDHLIDAGAEVVIALTHSFMADDIRLAEEVPGIDLILGGHDHTREYAIVNGTPVIKSGSDLRHMAKVDLYLLNSTKPLVLFRWLPLDRSVAEDPETLELVAEFEAVLDETLGEVVGQTLVPFDTNRDQVRRVEAPIGNLIADAQREFVDADVALMNGGSIRGDRIFEAGDVTGLDVFTILPFNNVIVKVELTGEQLLGALENSVSQAEFNAGRFAQVSGMSFTVDLQQEPGSRVSDVMVGGAPLDLARTYTASVNDYIVEGGDGYESLTGTRKVIDELAGPLLVDVVTNYIRDNSPVNPQVEGRINFR